MNTRSLLFLIALSTSLHAAPPPELTALRQQYDKAVTTPHETALADLNTKFTAALANAVTAAKQAGKLDEVLAIQEDQKRLAEKLPLPDDTDTTPESLKKLRGIYRGQLAKLEAQRTANQTALLPAYTAKLKELEATLTKADRIDEAKEVMVYRENLASGRSPSEAQVANVPSAGTAAMPAVPPAHGNGDDRAAGELILSLGGRVMLRGKPEWITSSADLPKGRFALARIEFIKSDLTKRQLEATDVDKLSHLEEIDWFFAKSSIRDDESLKFLATWPKLKFLAVQDCGWLTGSWLQYAVPLKNLTSLEVIEAAKDEMAAIASFQSSGFTIIQFRNIPADDQTLEVIGRFKALKQLRLRHTQITDAGMTHLSGLKSLDSLDVSETRISIAGMKALAGAQLTELGFGMSPDDMAAVTQELAVLFPKVADFQYPPGGTTAARHLNALGKAWPKLKRLEFPSYHEFEPDAFISAGPLFPTLEYLYLWRTKINDSHMPGIVQMKKLNTLVLHDTQVTDAALTELQKLNSLKKIYLNDTKVTEAGLTAFKKARRDVFVSGGRP